MKVAKEFNDIIEFLGRKHGRRTVFYDFCHMSALALAQQVYQSDELEAKYMEHVKKYNTEEANSIARLLTLTHQAFYENPSQDFLGERFMENDLTNAKTGQFFTPYFLSLMNAKMLFGGTLNGKDYVTVGEPAAGAGGMIIAFANVMEEAGFKPTKQMLAIATDIDSLCFSMCYVQLSLLGIPALVQHGDTLRQEMWREFVTPSLAEQFDTFAPYFLEQKEEKETTEETDITETVIVLDKPRGKAKAGQFGLFG